MKRLLTLLVLLPMSGLRAQPPAGARPAPWSAGAFLYFDSQPYRGASSQVRLLPAVTYQGERLQWQGPLLRVRIAQWAGWKLSAHAALQFAAYEEDDAPILAGMGDRSSTLLGGLDLERNLGQNWSTILSMDTDLFGAHDGSQVTLGINRSFRHPHRPLFGGVGAGLLFQDANWTRYAVGVPESRATPDRPAYDPDESFHPFLVGRLVVRLNSRWSLLTIGRVEFLDESWRDSPLIGEDHRWTAFSALTWSF